MGNNIKPIEKVMFVSIDSDFIQLFNLGTIERTSDTIEKALKHWYSM